MGVSRRNSSLGSLVAVELYKRTSLCLTGFSVCFMSYEPKFTHPGERRASGLW